MSEKCYESLSEPVADALFEPLASDDAFRSLSIREKRYEDLPEPVADALLGRLAVDDSFRDLFSADPRAALVELGYQPAISDASTGIWESLTVNQLASKETFSTSLAQLRSDVLAARVVADPISLDQGR